MHPVPTSDVAPAPTARPRMRRVVVVDDLAGLEAHADAWDRLALAPTAPFAAPFSSHAWIASYLETKLEDGDDAWRCYFAYDGDRLEGVLAGIEAPHRLFGRGRPWLRVPPDFYTHEGNVLLDPETAPDAARTLLAGARTHEPGLTGARLGLVREGSGTVQALKAADQGPVLDAHDLDGRLIRLEGDWSAYEAKLGRNFRRNLKKARNRAKKAGWTYRFLTGAQADPAFLDAFLELEGAGWKGSWGDAVQRTPNAVAFYRALTRRLAARGWLSWHVLEAEGRVVAAHLGVRFGRSIVLVRIAYDESEKRLAPGNLLLAELIERTLETGEYDWIDCITDMPWHEDWAMERLGYAAVRWFPRGALPWATGALPLRTRNALARIGWLKRLAARLRKPPVDARSGAAIYETHR